jgi:alpha-L-fucosidase
MKTTPFKLLLGAAIAAASLGLRADDAAAREQTLRFPEDIRKNAPFAEIDPDADYRHASPAAYEAFRQMKYGVRIHWGLYSKLPDARESWSFLPLSDAERQRYIESVKDWNPTAFNAEQWMQFFDRAGFRTFAITTKHHEGFSLWDTHTRVLRRPNYVKDPRGPVIEDCDVAYSVMETPFKRDIIKELTDAGRAHGLKINLYFSHTDWYDADFRPYGRHPLQYAGSPGIKSLEERQLRPAFLGPAPTAEEKAHRLQRHRAQLQELLRNYGKIDMVCLDIALGAEDWPAVKQTIKELRALQPEVMFRNRGIGNYGDYYTPERVVPGEKAASPMPWMVIYPLGTNFSYEAEAAKHKGAKWVVDNLVDSVAKGGNFMVGIGPDGTGRFHPTAIAQLEEVGAWLRQNGEGIFNTHARPGAGWKDGDDIRLTESDDGRHTFAILLKAAQPKVTLHQLRLREGSKVTLLGHPAALAWKANGSDVEIELPQPLPASLAHILKLETGR